ncbi:XdhC family protein [Aquibacillus halophilus]|uniref:XdhC family protein n=2 Tax=Aquibacillus halophilus TaxID=930132 RepID=A0A6A8DMV1_9BACI|nr:XdhC family protein [Aquibacillus halophilus]
MEDIYTILDEVCGASCEGSILASVVHVEGSAYKKEGAMMIFKKDGSQIGMLSAGCLEEDLAARIEHHGLGRQSETIVYDMRGSNEISWGEGSGCNGVIHVLVEPINSQLINDLSRLKSILDNGHSVTMIKHLPSDSQPSTYLFITEDNHTFGNLSGKVTEELRGLVDQTVSSIDKSFNTCVSSLGEKIYIHHIQPKSRLIVFGAGKDAIPLVSFASKTGFSVTVADWRPALCNHSNFPEANELILGFPEEIINQIEITARDYVVILTHNFQKDKEILSALIHKDIKYLGVLGSSKRTKRLLGTKKLPPQIKTPIGLSIGADGPEQIAISIVAELIQFSKKREMKKVFVS